MNTEQKCDDCTGDGGGGHTLRGACMGAPCPACGEARYLHLPGECQPADNDPTGEAPSFDTAGKD